MFGFVVSAATNCGVILITSIDDFSKENRRVRRTDLPAVRLCVGDPAYRTGLLCPRHKRQRRYGGSHHKISSSHEAPVSGAF